MYIFRDGGLMVYFISVRDFISELSIFGLYLIVWDMNIEMGCFEIRSDDFYVIFDCLFNVVFYNKLGYYLGEIWEKNGYFFLKLMELYLYIGVLRFLINMSMLLFGFGLGFYNNLDN